MLSWSNVLDQTAFSTALTSESQIHPALSFRHTSAFFLCAFRCGKPRVKETLAVCNRNFSLQNQEIPAPLLRFLSGGHEQFHPYPSAATLFLFGPGNINCNLFLYLLMPA